VSNLAYTLTVNGEHHDVRDSWIGESLLSVLRDRVGLYGTKGSCSVLVDGELVCACLMLAASAQGAEIVTIEGLAPDGTLTDVQRAFVDSGAVQCGFCTPGLVVAVHHLLDAVPEPTELQMKEALSGNICRCTGYGRIFAAVESVVELRSSGS
jgi:carbon-monoxide dehydrogenase small subunit